MMWGAAATARPPSSAETVPFGPRLLGIAELEELPQGLYGSARASALAAVDRRYHYDALIVADLSNDATYAEVLCETFGPRVIGLQISRHGDGMNAERRPVKHGAMLVYTIGRTYLLELFHSEMQSDQVRIVDGPTSRRAYEQLTNLETEMRESGIVYTCPPGQHDDLGISCAIVSGNQIPGAIVQLQCWISQGIRNAILTELRANGTYDHVLWLSPLYDEPANHHDCRRSQQGYEY